MYLYIPAVVGCVFVKILGGKEKESEPLNNLYTANSRKNVSLKYHFFYSKYKTGSILLGIARYNSLSLKMLDVIAPLYHLPRHFSFCASVERKPKMGYSNCCCLLYVVYATKHFAMLKP